MSCFRYRVLAAAAIALLSVGSAVSAGVVYDNIGVASKGSDPVAADGPLANSFSTGGSTVLLADVKLLLIGNPNSTASSTVSLLSDSGTSPGSVLQIIGTLSDSSLSASAQVFDFVLATPYALAANTRFWIGLSGPSSTTVGWNYAVDSSGIGTTGEYWAYSPGGTLTVRQNSGTTSTPYQMQLSAVPEPGSLGLFMIGSAALAIARRRLVRP